jgi:tRNA pseudouridine38-40 synthase
MRTLKLTLAYDGTRFVGWQRQPNGESVQGLLEAALEEFEGAAIAVHGAGRTDAGVHASGQVASVCLECPHDCATLARGLNARLPPDIRVILIEEAPPGFHARFSARSKTYRYLIANTPTAGLFERAYVWHLREPLNLEAMSLAARAVEGTHDFSAFQSAGSDTSGTVRTIAHSAFRHLDPRSEFLSEGVIAYEITGDGFLRHMVRAIVGTLVEVGRGWRTVDSMMELVAGETRSAAGATAPPHGLFLVRVDYD